MQSAAPCCWFTAIIIHIIGPHTQQSQLSQHAHWLLQTLLDTQPIILTANIAGQESHVSVILLFLHSYKFVIILQQAVEYIT